MTGTITAEQVEATVLAGLAELGAPREALTRDTSLDALDLDSLDIVELAQIVEDAHGVALRHGDVERVLTVGDAIDLFVARRP
jgi:acyl carrier protein